MKKLIMACGVAALVLGATSCNKGCSTSECKTLGDSVSVFFGQVNGGMLARNMAGDPQASQWDKNEILNGMMMVLKTDTANEARLVGINLGMQIAQQIKRMEDQDSTFSRETAIAEFKKAFLADSVADLDEASTTLRRLMSEQRQAAEERRIKEREAKANVNKEAGKAFVDSLKAADATIKTTESGLAYKVINEGSGVKPTADDVAKVKYVGKLINGNEFDNSNGQVREFPLKRVVAGFGEGLQLMSPGSKYVLYIPSDLGYGNAGAPQVGIEPGSTLIFEVELVEVVPAKK